MITSDSETHGTTQRNYQRPSRFVPILNPLIKGLLHFGIPMGPMALLTVRGRRSGHKRSTPVATVRVNDETYIVSVYGLSQWVQNLRAARQANVKYRWTSREVAVNELSSRDAAPILMQAYKMSPGFLRKYFDVNLSSTLEDFERDARNHPVFVLSTRAD